MYSRRQDYDVAHHLHNLGYGPVTGDDIPVQYIPVTLIIDFRYAD